MDDYEICLKVNLLSPTSGSYWIWWKRMKKEMLELEELFGANLKIMVFECINVRLVFHPCFLADIPFDVLLVNWPQKVLLTRNLSSLSPSLVSLSFFCIKNTLDHPFSWACHSWVGVWIFQYFLSDVSTPKKFSGLLKEMEWRSFSRVLEWGFERKIGKKSFFFRKDGMNRGGGEDVKGEGSEAGLKFYSSDLRWWTMKQVKQEKSGEWGRKNCECSSIEK